MTLQKEHLNKQNMADKHITTEIGYRIEDATKLGKKEKELNEERTKIIEESETLKEEIPTKRVAVERKREELDEVKTELAKYDNPELREKVKEAESEAKRNTVEL